jgi:hypothetical protein
MEEHAETFFSIKDFLHHISGQSGLRRGWDEGAGQQPHRTGSGKDGMKMRSSIPLHGLRRGWDEDAGQQPHRTGSGVGRRGQGFVLTLVLWSMRLYLAANGLQPPERLDVDLQQRLLWCALSCLLRRCYGFSLRLGISASLIEQLEVSLHMSTVGCLTSEYVVQSNNSPYKYLYATFYVFLENLTNANRNSSPGTCRQA